MLLALLLAAPLSSEAQSDVETIERLEVRLWPDFDRPSLLTTLVGILPPGTPERVTITLPVPEGTSIHVISPLREDGRPGPEMPFNDAVQGQVTFTTDSPGFWLEYYSPYTADGAQRDFSFEWQSEMTVDQLEVVVQQPMMSSDLSTSPAAEDVTTGPDGMQYHQLPVAQVPAGTKYTLEGNYSLARPQLSQEVSAGQPAPVGTESPEESGFNWIIAVVIAAGIVAVAAFGWLLWSHRQNSRRVVKPRPQRRSAPRSASPEKPAMVSPSGSKDRFCHECGQRIEPGDRYCRSCGTAVKNSM